MYEGQECMCALLIMSGEGHVEYPELDTVDDGQPVQLFQCWRDVITWTKLQDNLSNDILSTLQ